ASAASCLNAGSNLGTCREPSVKFTCRSVNSGYVSTIPFEGRCRGRNRPDTAGPSIRRVRRWVPGHARARRQGARVAGVSGPGGGLSQPGGDGEPVVGRVVRSRGTGVTSAGGQASA